MGNIRTFPEALGQGGNPFLIFVEDHPRVTRPKHTYLGDVIFHYVKGSKTVAHEGVFEAGDVRFVKAGEPCGPEECGPDGSSYWITSYSDPSPIDYAEPIEPPTFAGTRPTIRRFKPTDDAQEIAASIKRDGVAIIEGALDQGVLAGLNRDVDAELTIGEVDQDSSSKAYNRFKGEFTTRVYNVAQFSDSAVDVICNAEMVEMAEHLMASRCSSVLLNAAMVLQVNPGETPQYIHSDLKSWPTVPGGGEPVNITAIYALSDFTEENGATVFAPGSWGWEEGRNPKNDELVAATMAAGDAVLFRADCLHGAGGNTSENHSRRGLFISYCAGWLRPVENIHLGLTRERLAEVDRKLLPLIGFKPHDASRDSGGIIGLVNGEDPLATLNEN